MHRSHTATRAHLTLVSHIHSCSGNTGNSPSGSSESGGKCSQSDGLFGKGGGNGNSPSPTQRDGTSACAGNSNSENGSDGRGGDSRAVCMPVYEDLNC